MLSSPSIDFFPPLNLLLHARDLCSSVAIHRWRPSNVIFHAKNLACPAAIPLLPLQITFSHLKVHVPLVPTSSDPLPSLAQHQEDTAESTATPEAEEVPLGQVASLLSCCDFSNSLRKTFRNCDLSFHKGGCLELQDVPKRAVAQKGYLKSPCLDKGKSWKTVVFKGGPYFVSQTHPKKKLFCTSKAMS